MVNTVRYFILNTIVMHCFCVYMNSRLPSHPNYPQAKTFTGQYFKTSTVKTTNEQDHMHILLVKVYPAHYNIVLKDDDIIQIPKGRNNVFYSIIVFLYFIKHKHHGFLGRVNLGPSGVNILWAIDS